MILSLTLKCVTAALLFTVHPHLGYAYLIMVFEAVLGMYQKQAKMKKIMDEVEKLGGTVITGEVEDDERKDR